MSIFALKAMLQRHFVAGICAILVGGIIVAPTFIFRHDATYRGVEVFGSDGESSYIAQVRAIYNGNFGFGNVFLYEGQNEPYVKQPLPGIITAALGKVLWLDVPNAIIAAKIILPAATFLLVYAFGLALTRRRDVALLGAIFVLLSPATTALLDPKTVLPLLLKGTFIGSDPQFLLYARPITPQVSSLFFFGYLLSLFTLWWGTATQTPKRRILLGTLCAVLLGLSFYTYLFTFTLLFAISGLLWIFFLVKRDWKKFTDMTLIGFGGLLVGIPYFINMYHAIHSAYWAGLSVRVGQLLSHKPIFSRVAFGVGALVLLFHRKCDAFGVFALALIGSVLVLTNQQILTGHTIPIPSHYHWYYMAPLAGIMLLYLVYERFTHLRAVYIQTATTLLAVFFVAVGITFQVWSYNIQYTHFVTLQTYGPALSWLNTHATKDDVVFSNEELAELVPIYTPAHTYYNSYEGDYLVPEERLRQAFFAYMQLSGVAAKNADAYFNDPVNQSRFSNRVFSNYYPAKNGCYSCYPQELNAQFASEYRTYVTQSLPTNLAAYRLTYAVWNKKADPTWKLGQYFGIPVYEDADVALYAVR